MATEKLKFKIELYAEMWDKPPHAEILINNDTHFKGEITGTESKPSIIEFTASFEEKKSYNFFILRSGKDKNQTVVENGEIVKDQLLVIKNIEIDEIDIGSLVYEGVFTPDYPEPWATQQRESGNDLKDSFKNVTHMGFNGKWHFKFESPFYMWLLENLY